MCYSVRADKGLLFSFVGKFSQATENAVTEMGIYIYASGSTSEVSESTSE